MRIEVILTFYYLFSSQVPAEANEEGGGEEEDVEDVSEEACISRHDRSEVEERKKFMSYLKQPPGASRGRRRVDHIDSRAESSGANTPDPMSPHDGSKCGSDRLDAGDPCMDETELTDAGHQFSVSAVKERRRTASLTKKADNVFRFYDDNSAMSWEMDEVILHAITSIYVSNWFSTFGWILIDWECF